MSKCTGCREAEPTTSIVNLGRVCDSCAEHLDVVFEVEIERAKDRYRTLRAAYEIWKVDNDRR
jgi:hypothetical protein